MLAGRVQRAARVWEIADLLTLQEVLYTAPLLDEVHYKMPTRPLRNFFQGHVLRILLQFGRIHRFF